MQEKKKSKEQNKKKKRKKTPSSITWLSKLWYVREILPLRQFLCNFSAKLTCHSLWKFYDHANRMNVISTILCIFRIIKKLRIVQNSEKEDNISLLKRAVLCRFSALKWTVKGLMSLVKQRWNRDGSGGDAGPGAICSVVVWCCWGTSALKNLDSMMLTIDNLKIMICH